MQEVTRGPGEAIMLGDDIQIIILDIENGQARIGVRDLSGGLELQDRTTAMNDSGNHAPNAPIISGKLLSGR